MKARWECFTCLYVVAAAVIAGRTPFRKTAAQFRRRSISLAAPSLSLRLYLCCNAICCLCSVRRGSEALYPCWLTDIQSVATFPVWGAVERVPLFSSSRSSRCQKPSHRSRGLLFHRCVTLASSPTKQIRAFGIRPSVHAMSTGCQIDFL